MSGFYWLTVTVNFQGMDHQGIFRVPGSSTEINDMKEAFENGKNYGIRDSFPTMQTSLVPRAFAHGSAHE